MLLLNRFERKIIDVYKDNRDTKKTINEIPCQVASFSINIKHEGASMWSFNLLEMATKIPSKYIPPSCSITKNDVVSPIRGTLIGRMVVVEMLHLIENKKRSCFHQG